MSYEFRAEQQTITATIPNISVIDMAEKSQICLFTAQTPNGHKVSIVLEELDLPYDVRHMDMPAIEHKEPWFLEINPNGRIPALTDVLPDGTPIALFESGAIMQYLVDRYDTGYKISYPRGTKEYYQTNSWVNAKSTDHESKLRFVADHEPF
jgi:glutathione S-transferase